MIDIENLAHSKCYIGMNFSSNNCEKLQLLLEDINLFLYSIPNVQVITPAFRDVVDNTLDEYIKEGECGSSVLYLDRNLRKDAEIKIINKFKEFRISVTDRVLTDKANLYLSFEL